MPSKKRLITYNFGEQIQYLKQIAESVDKNVKLAEKQRNDAIQDAKRERKRFYVSLSVTIILGVVAVIVGVMAL